MVGANGFLARAILRCWNSRGAPVVTASHSGSADLVIDLATETPPVIGSLPPDITHGVICSAVTSVDRCLSDWDYAYRLNVTNTIALIDEMATRGIRPVFCSTDQVFKGGTGGYDETDEPEPQTAYGRQKVAVENHLRSNHPDGIIIRMGKLFGALSEDTSPIAQTVQAIRDGREIPAASDFHLSMTHIDDVAGALWVLAENNARGIYHLASETSLTRLDLATAIAAAAGRPELVRPISIDDLDLLEPRPKNTVLDSAKFRSEFGWTFQKWEDRLSEVSAAFAVG